VDADLLDGQEGDPKEHIRRLSEIAHILLDAGMILIVTATDLNQEHIEIIRAASQSDLMEIIWVGDTITTDLVPDLHITSDDLKHQDNAERIKSVLHESGAIFRFW
jgi:bifunctional enzyme CysN/CysC